jgi:hypothetical protein
MKHFIQKYKEIIIICILSLVVRLIIIPYAQSTDSDAASRVFIARNLLDNFQLLLSGYWGPIHHYFNALSLLIIPGNVYGPEVLSILFAVASCIPLYFFTKNEFNKQGAFFVALIYTFSPVVFKNSFLAMAEVCNAFFILLSMYFLSKGIRSEQKVRYAIYAGLSITVAGGVRFESWEIMAIFFIVLGLFKQWKMIIPFTLTALIFPVYWMIGSQVEQNDFLYSFHSVANFIDSCGYNIEVTKAEHVSRLFFFPISWVLMMTPFISIILLFTFFKKLFSGKINKDKFIWLVPFIVMMGTFIYTAYKGTLCTQHRFSITLVLFSVPYFALYFENERYLKLKKIIVFILIALMVPLSFYWARILPYKFYKANKDSSSILWTVKNSMIIEKNDAIPFIRDKSVDAFSKSINMQITSEKGLILDFIGWDKTYYIALNTGLSNKNIYIYDVNTQKIDTAFLTNFIKEYPEGLIMLKALSSFDNACHSQGDFMEIENVPAAFYLEKCLDSNNVKLFRYYVRSKEWADQYKSENPDALGITRTIKNVTYYENEIRNNRDWLKDVEAKAKYDNMDVDTRVRIDAKWMVDQDSINFKKDSI